MLAADNETTAVSAEPIAMAEPSTTKFSGFTASVIVPAVANPTSSHLHDPQQGNGLQTEPTLSSAAHGHPTITEVTAQSAETAASTSSAQQPARKKQRTTEAQPANRVPPAEKSDRPTKPPAQYRYLCTVQGCKGIGANTLESLKRHLWEKHQPNPKLKEAEAFKVDWLEWLASEKAPKATYKRYKHLIPAETTKAPTATSTATTPCRVEEEIAPAPLSRQKEANTNKQRPAEGQISCKLQASSFVDSVAGESVQPPKEAQPQQASTKAPLRQPDQRNTRVPPDEPAASSIKDLPETDSILPAIHNAMQFHGQTGTTTKTEIMVALASQISPGFLSEVKQLCGLDPQQQPADISSGHIAMAAMRYIDGLREDQLAQRAINARNTELLNQYGDAGLLVDMKIKALEDILIEKNKTIDGLQRDRAKLLEACEFLIGELLRKEQESMRFS